MKWNNFITMIMGSISGILFALGMCMGLLPEWHMFMPGIILGLIGAVGGLITLLVRRRMDGKEMIKLNLRTILITLYGIMAALIFGIGMSWTLVGGVVIGSIVCGIIGLVMLITLVPMIKGIVR